MAEKKGMFMLHITQQSVSSKIALVKNRKILLERYLHTLLQNPLSFH